MKHNVRDANGRFCKAPKTVELKVKGAFAEGINTDIHLEKVVRAITKVLNKGLLNAIDAKLEEGYEIVIISHQSLYDNLVKPFIRNELPFVSERDSKKLRKLYLECMPQVMLNYGLLVTVKKNMLQIVKMSAME